MNHTPKFLNESVLNTNLNDLAHSLLREMAMAAKKVSIYGCGHPVARRALGKPQMILGQIFRFKRYININLQRGNLYFLNFYLKDSLFTRDMIHFMQLSEIGGILFKHTMTPPEFNSFIERLVTREQASDHVAALNQWFSETEISTIEVNSDNVFDLFDSHRQYRGDVGGDFSVRQIALQQLGDDLNKLSEINMMEDQSLQAYGIDFHWDVIKYVLPEKVASLDESKIKETLLNLTKKIRPGSEDSQKNEFFETYISICKLIEFHPRCEQIKESLRSVLSEANDKEELIEQLSSSTGIIRQESSERIDSILDHLFDTGSESNVEGEFEDSFARLLKTGQGAKAREKIVYLIDMLGSSESDARQKALSLLVTAVGQLNMLTDLEVMEQTIERVVSKLADRRETYEYSELILRLFEKCLEYEKFELLARLTSGMTARKSIVNGVTIYDSMAIKQAQAGLNRKEVLGKMIERLTGANFSDLQFLKQILVNIGSEEVAFALTGIISHPERTVRQMSLKILAELGEPAVKICSQIISDDSLFEREKGRHELPDQQWYIIRNAIFVLGLLENQNGVMALRQRINDTDIRVRREIVCSLEKIGGEDACDLLSLMAEDSVQEIRERSVITIGLVGNSEMAPLLADLAQKNCSLTNHVVTAMGKIGGPEARTFLVALLEDESLLAAYAGGHISRDELKLAVIKSLGTIGDEESISKIRQFQKNMSSAQKLFFKGSSVNKTISKILSRH